ncbi:hypothetical protein SAMN05216188_10895 [Lentzea xinjiangensis]|uniref:Uncharacterized protein n=1 Tax=Lentzea xinjiangensis TaxID=402600 RepID=A0A1H9LTP6_9PSEU|nr:hypothetical protein [Lentzea xinjiangensis]SER14794.1 hypothetical protein SAMN05216188_10895 [Lentzea xinjiangensis]
MSAKSISGIAIRVAAAAAVALSVDAADDPCEVEGLSTRNPHA